MKKIAVLTGAGMSAESGLKTFRDAGGLWEEYPVQQVASHEGWLADPALADFVEGRLSADEAREHMKVEEQKWIRKARKYVLYENQPYRIK